MGIKAHILIACLIILIMPKAHAQDVKQSNYEYNIMVKKVGEELISEWGTGQYRINMYLTESCELNKSFYFANNKPNKNWKPEWKKMKRRKYHPTFWDGITAEFTRTFDIQNHQWVHTLLDPIQTAIVVDEHKWLNSIMHVEAVSTPTTPSANSANAASPTTPTNPNDSQKPQYP